MFSRLYRRVRPHPLVHGRGHDCRPLVLPGGAAVKSPSNAPSFTQPNRGKVRTLTTAVATIEPIQQFLCNVQSARDLLAGAAELPDVKRIRDKAAALQHFAKSAELGLEAQNFAALLKIESERKAGELLKMNGFGINGGDRKSAEKKSANGVLADLGITSIQSSRWRRMALLPDEELTDYIDDCQRRNTEITSSAVAKLAKKHVAIHTTSVPSIEPSEGVTEDLSELIQSGEKFKTVYADPPWSYGNQATRASTDNHYPTMPVSDICALPVKNIIDEQSLLFLWTTNGFLRESFDVIDAWGFEFKSTIVWVKPQMGIGNYVRNSHEFLMIATRGGAMPSDARKRQISWVQENRGRHSAKPKCFRRIVEEMSFPNRLELFGRSAVEGWMVFGNQIEKGLL